MWLPFSIYLFLKLNTLTEQMMLFNILTLLMNLCCLRNKTVYVSHQFMNRFRRKRFYRCGTTSHLDEKVTLTA